MAEKPIPVSVEARRLDISILPQGFSLPLTDYLVSQSDDVQSIASQANGAAEGAYQAQLTNDEQDALLAAHEQTLLSHGNRLDAAELTLQDHETRISAAELTLQDHETRISGIEGDYVSKSETSTQSLASPLNVTTSYSINGVKVVGQRSVGWLPSTGVGQKGNMYVDYTYIAGATYNQGEMQAIGNGLKEVRQVVKAIQDALSSHGLID